MRDGKTMLLGLSDGCLYSISWKGEVTLIFSGILVPLIFCTSNFLYFSSLVELSPLVLNVLIATMIGCCLTPLVMG